MIHKALSTTCGGDTYSKPAPVVSQITVTDLGGNAHPTTWPGLLDTGADGTAVPLNICEDLGLTPREWRTPRGFDPKAPTRRIPLYYTRFKTEGLPEVTLLVYGVPRTNILLGRDFQAGLTLLVDGESGSLRLGQKTALSRLLIPCIRLQ